MTDKSLIKIAITALEYYATANTYGGPGSSFLIADKRIANEALAILKELHPPKDKISVSDNLSACSVCGEPDAKECGFWFLGKKDKVCTDLVCEAHKHKHPATGYPFGCAPDEA